MPTVNDIRRAFDLNAVKNWTGQLHSYGKSCSHSDFAAAAEYCCKALAEAGFEQIEMVEHRADGKTAAFDCIMPPAWDLCGRSVLTVAGENTVLADTDVIPYAAAPWSAPTPPEGVTGEVVALEPGDDHDVRGKWVLHTCHDVKNPHGAYLEKLRAAGALGVVTADDYSGTDYPHSVRWFNGTGRFGWYPVAEDERLPMFAISLETAKLLRQRMAAGKVFLHGIMNCRSFPGKIFTVTAVIPGRSTTEYALFSHMYEPFAADNDIGFGLSCAIGKAIREVYGTPEKSLRVVFSMELYGFAAYLADRKRAARIAGALNMDAVNHRKARKLRFLDSPLSRPWFGDWVILDVMQKNLPGTAFIHDAGTLSDDTFAGDPLCGDVPVNWCMNPSGTAHHCGCDDFEADWDWAEDEFPAFAEAVAEMLNFSAGQAEKLPLLAAAEFTEKSRMIGEKQCAPAEKKLLLECLYQYLTGRLISAEKYCDVQLDKSVLDLLYTEKAAGFSGAESGICSEIEKTAAQIVPLRLKSTPFSMADIPVAQRQSFRVSRLLFALFDGKRSLLDAVRLRDWAGNTRSDDKTIAAEIVQLEYLAEFGYVELKNVISK